MEDVAPTHDLNEMKELWCTLTEKLNSTCSLCGICSSTLLDSRIQWWFKTRCESPRLCRTNCKWCSRRRFRRRIDISIPPTIGFESDVTVSNNSSSTYGFMRVSPCKHSDILYFLQSVVITL